MPQHMKVSIRDFNNFRTLKRLQRLDMNPNSSRRIEIDLVKLASYVKSEPEKHAFIFPLLISEWALSTTGAWRKTASRRAKGWAGEI